MGRDPHDKSPSLAVRLWRVIREEQANQRDLDAAWLSEFFPRQPHAAYFSFDVPQKEDAAALLEQVGNLSWAGYRVDQKQLEEKTGLKLIPVEPPQ